MVYEVENHSSSLVGENSIPAAGINSCTFTEMLECYVSVVSVQGQIMTRGGHLGIMFGLIYGESPSGSILQKRKSWYSLNMFAPCSGFFL